MEAKKVKPILFNTDMTRAIQNGTKTVTRRVVKEPALSRIVIDDNGCVVGSLLPNDSECICYPTVDDCPYQPGQVLYVRETWQNTGKRYIYKADVNGVMDDVAYHALGWRPSIHMPREAARIFLRVTDVRVERLQDITEEQSIKEGCIPVLCENCYGAGCSDCAGSGCLEPAMLEFVDTWNSTVKRADRARYGWDANPWVWVIAFERISKEEAEHEQVDQREEPACPQ